jgi:hypothetical protein
MGLYRVYPPLDPPGRVLTESGGAMPSELVGLARTALFVAQVFGLAACAFALALFVMGPLMRADAAPALASAAASTPLAAHAARPAP